MECSCNMPCTVSKSSSLEHLRQSIAGEREGGGREGGREGEGEGEGGRGRERKGGGKEGRERE